MKRQKKKSEIDVKKFLKEITPMIWFLMRRYYFPYVDRIDIADECLSVVLTKALQKYNSKKGASFKTYYYWKVRSFLSNRYKYYTTKKRQRKECSIYDEKKYIKCKRLGTKISLQNLLFSRHSWSE